MKSYYKCLGLAFSAFFVTSTISLAYAEKINVGVLAFEPWGFKENKEIVGIMWDQSKAILQRAGLEGVPDYAPYPRMIKRLKEGKTDLAIFIRNDVNKDVLNFVSHLYDLKIIVITHKDIEIKKYEDFYRKDLISIVGIPNGGEGFFPKLYNDERIEKHTTVSQRHGVQMIGMKRISAFVGIDKTILYEMNKNKVSDKVNFPGYEVGTLAVWLQWSKNSKKASKYIDRFREIVTEMKKGHEFQKIINRWINVE